MLRSDSSAEEPPSLSSRSSVVSGLNIPGPADVTTGETPPCCESSTGLRTCLSRLDLLLPNPIERRGALSVPGAGESPLACLCESFSCLHLPWYVPCDAGISAIVGSSRWAGDEETRPRAGERSVTVREALKNGDGFGPSLGGTGGGKPKPEALCLCPKWGVSCSGEAGPTGGGGGVCDTTTGDCVRDDDDTGAKVDRVLGSSEFDDMGLGDGAFGGGVDHGFEEESDGRRKLPPSDAERLSFRFGGFIRLGTSS